MTLRPLHENDIPDIVNIENATQHFPWTLDIFQRCLQIGYIGWVLEEQEHIIGFIIVSMQNGECHIMNLAVHPSFQRQGHAEALLSEALKAAEKKGMVQVLLEVRKSNQPAINLYEKMNFIQIAERKNYYPARSGHEDALLFAKDLTIQ